MPIFRGLASLKGKVKHPGKYRSNVEAKVFEDLREEPIRASALMR